MHLDLSTLSPVQTYALMTQTVIPRPVAWILSENDDKSYNLAPYSYFNAIATVPPMIMVSMAPLPGGAMKGTRENIEARKEFMPGTSLPRLADCRLAYACELDSIHMIKKQSVVFGNLKHLYAADEVVSEDAKGRMAIDAKAVDPIGRLGGGEYFGAGEIITIERPA